MKRAAAAVLTWIGLATCRACGAAIGDGSAPRLYVRRAGEASKAIRELAEPFQLAPVTQLAIGQTPGAVISSYDGKNMYALTQDSLRSLRVLPGGGVEQFQELRSGVVDAYGNTVQYFTGLTALAISPEGENVYVVGTSVMPGVGGITTLARDLRNGQLSIAQQFRVDQRQGIVDIEGMVGANSVAVSPDGRFVYVCSGGYYRDHNLLVFSRDRSAGGLLSLVQNIDLYNTTDSRILPTTLVVSHEGDHVYVLGNNYAISTAAIAVYSVDGVTGRLTMQQELGPLRGTLLATAAFDTPGDYLYVTASLGNSLVWVFKRLPGGELTAQVPPTSEGSPVLTPPQGSYAGAISIALAPGSSSSLLFVAVEKDNVVYGAKRSDADGRLTYLSDSNVLPTTVGRPVGLSMGPDGKVLYLTSASDGSLFSFAVPSV